MFILIKSRFTEYPYPDFSFSPPLASNSKQTYVSGWENQVTHTPFKTARALPAGVKTNTRMFKGHWHTSHKGETITTISELRLCRQECWWVPVTTVTALGGRWHVVSEWSPSRARKEHCHLRAKCQKMFVSVARGGRAAEPQDLGSGPDPTSIDRS